MKIVQDAIRFPVTTAVGVILLVLFGTLSLSRIPVQLTPNVEDPEITISTFWPGASPQEVEREIVDEQEEQLKSLEGLVEMESSSSDSSGSITLTFQVGTDIDSALLRVSNRLEQVPAYPEDADKPVIRTVDPNSNAMAWFILEPIPGTVYDGQISRLFDFCNDILKPEIERVPGVGTAGIFGGEQREMQVIADPAELAARQVTLNQLAAALERENRNYSAGDFDEGKRRYIVRTTGEYRDTDDIENIVIAVRNNVPIYLRDVAHAEIGYRKPQAKVFEKGRLLIAMNAVKESGTNAIEVMAGIKDAVSRVNQELLAERGLQLRQVYDQTEYIESAISLVQQSLVVGGLLALLVLLIYLRSGTSTLVIFIAIPISVIGAFMMMYAFGRSLNVISLAGMAFAVGMVVDNSIVVLENIYRHRQMGKSRREAAHDGAREVWGAVLASTLTTIAVFVPVVFIQEEAGQLFGDIAIAISCAVALSLIVAITVIPSLSAKILSAAGGRDSGAKGFHSLWGGVNLAQRFTDTVTGTVDWINGSTVRRLVVIVGLTGAAVGLSLLLMPQAEYLPLGNQNFLIGFMLPPPGLSLNEMAELQDIYKTTLEPLWQHQAGSPEAVAQPGGGIQNYFFVTLNNFAFIVASANDPMRVRELIPSFFAGNAEVPGAYVVVNQSSIFERGLGAGRNIDVQIAGPELERLIVLGREVIGSVMQKLPGSQARPIPSLDLGNPEVQVRTHRRRAAELGISNRDLGFAVSALVDGVKASDFRFEGKEIDLKVMAAGDVEHHTHLLEQMPIATPDGRLVTLGSVAEVTVVSGPTTINHAERERTITIQVTPGEHMPLQEAMTLIETEIVQPMKDAGRLGGLYQAGLSGSADKLTQTGRALKLNLLLALAITYLLMAALFESFLYPFVIMFSVPLAALGGFLGLATVNLFVEQHMDVLTMLGFIILIGTVVNNPILIIHQSLNHMRDEGMNSRHAIRESVRTRIRPIFMSVSTSVFGMLPLVLVPGAGSELYRGLGGVVVGGLLVSTVFTLFLVPALFSLSLDIRTSLTGWLRRLSLSPHEADAQ